MKVFIFCYGVDISYRKEVLIGVVGTLEVHMFVCVYITMHIFLNRKVIYKSTGPPSDIVFPENH